MTKLRRAYQVEDAYQTEHNDRIVQELPQVYYIAARIHERLPKHVELGDLIGVGVLGLIEALATFDSSCDTSFSTFAKFRVRGAILDSLRSLDWGSRALRHQGRAIAVSTETLTMRLRRRPLLEEVAEDLNVSLAELHETLRDVDGLSTANQQMALKTGEQDSYDLIEAAEDADGQSPFDLCLRAEMRAQLIRSLRVLSPREQMMLSLYYQEDLTMREVGDVLGIGTARVSQLMSRALNKLSRELKHLKDEPTV